MHDVLFARYIEQPTGLTPFATRVFEILGLTDFEERESSNYINGRYFTGYAASSAIEVCDSDSADIPDYPFWIVVASPHPGRGATQIIDPTPHSIATQLAAGGVEVFIPTPGWGRVGWVSGGTRYSPQDR